MKKIMFNDRYGLTQAVLKGRKTMTRRTIPTDETKGGVVPVSFWSGKWCGAHGRPLRSQPYKIGEVVAVAQSYLSVHDEMMDGDYGDAVYDPFRWAIVDDKPGWSNKMFVKADLMPHQIRITNVRVERLQDISDEDCVKEGVWEAQQVNYTSIDGIPFSPREAFAALIDKVSGKGTWESNPYVFVYEFELIR